MELIFSFALLVGTFFSKTPCLRDDRIYFICYYCHILKHLIAIQ